MRWALRAIIVAGLVALAGRAFFAGIGWGLPSANVDSFLFGDREVWTGPQVLELAPARDSSSLGADVDRNPIAIRDTPIILNGTDAQRAEIVRRYRLFTYQPDEMITLMALAQMRPGTGDLDPRLYQYGGLWIYGVGGMLGLGQAIGYLTVRPDQAFYLDHPEQFGRFYVMARLYSALWGLLGVWAVYRLARFFTRRRWAPAIAAICFIFMPVVLTGAHEAKPHLAGTVLVLLAMIAAVHYAREGQARWCIAAGILAGAAVGMVLSAWAAFAVIPTMVLLRRTDPARRRVQAVAAAALLCAVSYIVTNPYVAINLVVNRNLLLSNLGNTQAMYGISGSGLGHSALLVAEGMSPALAIYGVLGAVGLWLIGRRTGRAADGAGPIPGKLGWIIAVPAILVLAQFALSAAGKPAEYGRFFLLPDVALMLAAILAIDRLTGSAVLRLLSYGFLTMTVLVFGLLYERAFLRDSGAAPARVQWADRLERLNRQGGRTLGVFAEPAPYSLPPVDLWNWQIFLLPRDGDWAGVRPDLIVVPADTLESDRPPAPGYALLPDVHVRQPIVPKIPWADKPLAVWVRQP